MKRNLIFTAVIVSILFASCATQDHDKEFDAVYQKYIHYLILDDAQKYTVVKGDTLSKIAKTAYDKGMYYPVIMLASSHVVKDPDKIYPGAILMIPNLETNLKDESARSAIKGVILDCAGIEARRKRNSTADAMRELANTL